MIKIIITGVLVFTLGQILVRFFLEPLHEFKKTLAEIHQVLLFHANNYGQEYKFFDDYILDKTIPEFQRNERIQSHKNWNEHLNKAQDETRSAAAKLIGAAGAIPFYSIFAKLKLTPTEAEILEAKHKLIGLSNSFPGANPLHTAKKSDELAKILKLKFY